MTFNSREISIASGTPIRFYLFQRGFMTWGYCTADRDIIYSSVVYRSSQISDGGIRQTGEATADTVEITAPADLPVAQLFRGLGPSSSVKVVISDMHYGDTEAIIEYIGSIYGVQWPAEDRCKISCQNSEVSLNKTGLSMTWGRTCEHVWGQPGCNVNRDLYRLDTTIQSITGATISNGAFAAKPDGWYAGGTVEWPVSGGITEQRNIEKHVGSVLTLLGGTEGLGLNQAIAAFPGCDLLIQTCHDKFANEDNHSGAPHQPGVNPFGSTSVF